MEQPSLDYLPRVELAICRCDRWQAYQRLQVLEIQCFCNRQGSLEVEVNSPLAVIQVWSAMQQFTRSRSELAAWLNQCWQLKG